MEPPHAKPFHFVTVQWVLRDLAISISLGILLAFLAASLFLCLVGSLKTHVFEQLNLFKALLLIVVLYFTFVFAEALSVFFYLPEFVKANGVLAIVLFGLYMSSHDGHTAMLLGGGEDLINKIEIVLSFVTLLACEVLFVLAGVIAARTLMPLDHGYKIGEGGHPGAQGVRDVLDLLHLYVAIHVVKMLILLLFYPLLSSPHMFGYAMSLKEMVVMTLAGQRGAAPMALALAVLDDQVCYSAVCRAHGGVGRSGMFIRIILVLDDHDIVSWILERRTTWRVCRSNHVSSSTSSNKEHNVCSFEHRSARIPPGSVRIQEHRASPAPHAHCVFHRRNHVAHVDN